MWFVTYFIVVSNVFMVFNNASLNGMGSIRNQIHRLEQILAAQKAMNNELRTALHQTDKNAKSLRYAVFIIL